MSDFQFSQEYAQSQDAADPLKSYRDKFHLPQFEGEPMVYFTGNSLGLQPKSTKEYLQQELDDWAEYGVEGHFDAKRPWFAYHEFFAEKLGRVVGAKPTEVVAMNSLTTNLHLLMVSFYRPQGKRTKILCEQKAFPSDAYALKSQLRFHGLDESHLIEIAPREDELIDEQDIYDAIEKHKDELAMIMIGGVNYYTGQVFDMAEITKRGQAVGATVGFDLAHGAGNYPVQLHDWGVDFAAWCSYKYLNSGPGAIGGVYIHERHHNDENIPRFEGWWGHDKKERFLMEDTFKPILTAEAWQLSNAPVLNMAGHLASLDIFDEMGLDKLREKSLRLTDYLAFVVGKVQEETGVELQILTPLEYKRRGCQLSIVIHGRGKEVFKKMAKNGVVADWREPNVIRIAPVPLYNNYEDVWKFGEKLKEALV